jgi:hypothetical protein
LSLGDKQRMVSPFNDVELIERFHLLSNALQEMQRAESVAGSLHEWIGVVNARSTSARSFAGSPPPHSG